MQIHQLFITNENFIEFLIFIVPSRKKGSLNYNFSNYRSFLKALRLVGIEHNFLACFLCYNFVNKSSLLIVFFIKFFEIF